MNRVFPLDAARGVDQHATYQHLLGEARNRMALSQKLESIAVPAFSLPSARVSAWVVETSPAEAEAWLATRSRWHAACLSA